MALVRNDSVEILFPLSKSDDFGATPYLVSSNRDANGRIEEFVRTREGGWQPEDTFYLMSDALAAWFCKEVEAGKSPWLAFRDLGMRGKESPRFEDLIGDLRTGKRIRNDDVTLIRVRLLED
jgi:hypothetical protein